MNRLPLVLLALSLPGPSHAAEVDFNRDIRPILSDKCFRCHGPDEGERKTDLRLDLNDSALDVVVPGNPRQSELVQRITSEDPGYRMPPAESGKSLSAAEVQQLERWIELGASWNDHWSFVAPRRPAFPVVRDSRWVRNPIDRFILARLEHLGRRPSTEAERGALIRRVTLDLTGLPPTLAEIRAFVADESPLAYDRLVERLLDSTRYGEHLARYWLDAARYGDTHGLHLDNERSVWPYRDWVINALNQNMPFDQFTIEQLAGDLISNPTLAQRVATGFNRCNVTTSEGGSIDEEYLVRYAVDRVETTSTVWLGLTTGCAVCHDHKFDPVSQEEFYRLFAYFFSLSEKAMDGNSLLPPPSVKVPTGVQRVHLTRIERELDDVERQIGDRQDRSLPRLKEWAHDYQQTHRLARAPAVSLLHCDFDESEGVQVDAGNGRTGRVVGTAMWDAGKSKSGLRLDGSTHVDLGDAADFERTDRFSLGGWVYPTDVAAGTVISRMSDEQAFRGYNLYVGGGKVFVHLIHKWDGNAIRVNTRDKLSLNAWQHVFATYDGSGKASGITIYFDGAPQELEVTHDSLRNTIRTSAALRIGKRSSSAPWRGSLDEIRVYAAALPHEEIQRLLNADPIAEIVKRPPDEWTNLQRELLLDTFLKQHDASYRALTSLADDLRSQRRRLRGSASNTLVMQEMSKPRVAHVLNRGQYDQPRAAVQPGVPAILPPLPEGAPANRLALARWLVDSANPLTARVTVNRYWQHLFGVGIVETAEDFGSQGSWPSHPELLDWLAVEFMESGWDVKALHRLIVTSATYRQSSVASHGEYERDPDNVQLARGPRFRVDAEMIRDAALAHAGLLVNRVGGKSVKPYQPDGLWSVVGYTTSNTSRFRQDHGPHLYRRSLYTFWKRTSPPPALQIFDAPSREVCVVRRARTNTPAGALVLMNDVQFIEAARHFAQRIILAEPADDARLRIAFETVTARAPDDFEIRVMRKQLRENLTDFQADGASASALIAVGESVPDGAVETVELAAWTMLVSTLLNLDEAVSKP